MRKKFELQELIAPGFALNEDRDICNICFDIKIDPVKCKTCIAEFCSHCAKRWVKSKDQCPNRCSQIWQYSQTQPLTIKIKCPYNCQTLITPNQFINHCSNCINAPAKVPEEILKQQYRCTENHLLVYISQPNEVPFNIECALCQKQKSICRSLCVQCKNNGQQFYRYCCQCRLPQNLTKTCCPSGHTNFHIRPSSKNVHILCDLCSKQIYPNACVEDKQCDVAMCLECYEKLQDGPGVPLDLLNYSEQQEQQPQNNGLLSFYQLMMNQNFASHLLNQQSNQISQFSQSHDSQFNNNSNFNIDQEYQVTQSINIEEASNIEQSQMNDSQNS